MRRSDRDAANNTESTARLIAPTRSTFYHGMLLLSLRMLASCYGNEAAGAVRRLEGKNYDPLATLRQSIVCPLSRVSTRPVSLVGRPACTRPRRVRWDRSSRPAKHFGRNLIFLHRRNVMIRGESGERSARYRSSLHRDRPRRL